VRIGLLSDTHGFLDDAVFTWFSECDEVWHAGDFGSVEVFERLRGFKPLRGVFGNIDPDLLRAGLPPQLQWQCEGVRVYMTHIGGHPERYESKAKAELIHVRPDLFICGHSHILRVARDPKLDLLYMNPGACGRQGWHAVRTVLRFNIEAGKISGVEAIELGPRSLTRGRRTASPASPDRSGY
jgi:putative phosphoesterase